MVMTSVIVGGRAIYLINPDHPRKFVTLNPKLKSTGRWRYQLFSRWWDAHCKQLGLNISPKSQDARHCSRLRSVALYLWLIVVISVRQIDRCSNIQPSLPGAGYGQFEHKADSLIAKFKEGRNGQRDWCMSRVTAIISALVICIIVCLSWAVNHYRG